VKFAIEQFDDCWDEIIENAEKHWFETEQYRHGQKFNPDKERYLQYEKAGIYIQFTARDKGKLAGHCGMYVMKSMHTQEVIATEDTWFLLPEYRKGRNAIKMYNFVEDEMKKRGVIEIMMTAKLGNKSNRIMEYLGYEWVARQFSKHLR